MDSIDRRGFLECMAWTGSALVWTSTGGVLSSRMVRPAEAAEDAAGGFSFVQISDTHIGFKGQANSDSAATLQQLLDRINTLRPAPAFVLHTGDQTHGQKPGAFDTLAEMLKGVKTERIFYVPGEHDVFLDGGKEYLTRYGKGTVVKLSPAGKILQEIPVLGDKPSNLCFGGPDGRTIYVTEVEHRRLVQFRVDRPGLAWQRWQEHRSR